MTGRVEHGSCYAITQTGNDKHAGGGSELQRASERQIFSIIVLVETAGRSLCEQHHTLTNKNMRSAAREVLIG